MKLYIRKVGKQPLDPPLVVRVPSADSPCSAVKEAVEAATGLRYERQRLLFDRRGNHDRIGGLVELVDEESLGLYEITSGATLYLGFLCMSVATPASKHAGADIDEVMRRAGL